MRAVRWLPIVFGILFALGAVEWMNLTGVFYPQGTALTYQADPKLVISHVPGSRGTETSSQREYADLRVEYNAHGFRGNWKEYPAGKARIFVLGDAFVEARQVKESASFIGRLNKAFPDKFFVNAGCDGHSPIPELLLLRERVLPSHPDRVFVFLSFDDYVDSAPFVPDPRILIGPPSRELVATFSASRPKRTWLAQHMAFVGLGESVGRSPAEVPPFRLDRSPLAANKLTPSLDPKETELLEFTHSAILKIHQVAKLNHVPITFFLIPLPMQINRTEWASGKTETLGFPSTEYEDRRVFQTRLMKLCETNHLDCVDLLPTMSRLKTKTPLHFAYDGRWTALGHKVVADIVKEHVFKSER